MGINTVRGNILKNAKKRQEEITEVSGLKNEIKKLVELASNFLKDENYRSAFFIYYRALKISTMLFMKEKMGNIEGISEDDALNFAAKREVLGLNPNVLETIKITVQKVLTRQKISKTEFERINPVKKALENED